MFSKFLSKLLVAPKIIGVTVVFLFILGLASYRSLRVDLFPPLNFPILNVITELPSFSSLEMERQVTLPIESAAGGVLGVVKVRSTSATGISMVSVEFQWGTDMLTARQLLIQALSSIQTQLPPGAESTIENLSATLSMIEGYSLQGSAVQNIQKPPVLDSPNERTSDVRYDLVRLRDIAIYDLKPRLQKIPGVYKVLVMGGKMLEYSVRPNPYLMIKYDVTLQDIEDALANNNILTSPGIVNHGAQELVLHANGQFADVSEMEHVVIAVKGGTPVRVKDVARVSKSFQYERGDTSERGLPAVLINILKQPSFDTGKVAQAINEEISNFASTLPSGFTVHNYYDQAQLVQNSIGSVKESVWIGGLLVILVLAFFLRSPRATLIAAVSIPISVTATIILMRAFGIGLNIMSLGGLAIGTGIIVDDTIVVLENIFRWLSAKELRRDLSSAGIVIGATREVILPVIVSTLTNIAIFLPMIYVEGFAGRLFAPVSLTVTFALLASLVVALTIIPTLATLWLAPQLGEGKRKDSAGILHRIYTKPLQFALKRPKTILGAALAAVLLVLGVFRRLNIEFLPALDEGAILLQTIMPSGASLPEARRLNRKLEQWIQGVPGVVTVVRRTGHAPGAEDTDNVNHSDILIKLLPKSSRPVSLDDFIDALKAQTAPIPSIVVNYLMPLADKINDAMGGVPADLGVDLFGPDLNQLHAYSSALVSQMEHIPGVTDLRPPTDIPVPSLEINIDKKEAGRLGISERTLYDTLQAYTLGLTVTNVREVQKEISVVLHFSPAGQNVDFEALRSLPLKTSGGSTVPLEQIAAVGFGEIPSEIYHQNLSRKLTITANLKDRNAKDVAQDVTKALSEIGLKPGYSWSFSGKYQTEQTALSNMALVLALAIGIVSLILWIEFQSAIQVGLILLTLPLAAVGAVLSLWLFRETVNVSSMIGAVLLVGVVVRNGILLLDYMNTELDEGKPLEQAITSAALKRARPILMTASVTILGLLPLATGWGTGSELQRPLAIAVIGGMLVSTLLTLVVLPAAALMALRFRRLS